MKLFELQEKHKTLGCTLVVTQNHLITLREDFTSPLRKIQKSKEPISGEDITNESQNNNQHRQEDSDNPQCLPETGSLVSALHCYKQNNDNFLILLLVTVYS